MKTRYKDKAVDSHIVVQLLSSSYSNTTGKYKGAGARATAYTQSQTKVLLGMNNGAVSAAFWAMCQEMNEDNFIPLWHGTVISKAIIHLPATQKS